MEVEEGKYNGKVRRNEIYPFISLNTYKQQYCCSNVNVLTILKTKKTGNANERERERESLAAQGISYYFLCILDSGELHRNGDKGSLAISTSVKSIFSIGLLVFELDFRLFDCKELKSGRLDHANKIFMPKQHKKLEAQGRKRHN